ncbi:hypothetical protein [Spiroplasma alleghenense]|uniref:Uncharacterized protein n=1 Tax=Spiroplasma alleghenense TaxID=216931 RepID=A0A345Z3B0_9MOLU|nr:hypothetical protein [Spiroplasma alleghenense]AXK51089.1 hypothetical protein SALLE_v1c04150 [Spiroplasma alleghenense]
MSNKNINNSDFALLSVSTKIRIKSLIEKKLTMQTVALFAQEYESLDFDIRREMNLYIKYLMDLELHEFIIEVEKLKRENKGSDVIRRQITFEEKQKNIRQLQSLLNNSEAIISNSYMRKDKYLSNGQSKYNLTNNLANKNSEQVVEKKVVVKKIQPITSNEKYKEALKREKGLNENMASKRVSLSLSDEEKRFRVPSNGTKKSKINLTEEEKNALAKRRQEKKITKSNIIEKKPNYLNNNDDFSKTKFKDFSLVKSRIVSDEEYQREQKEKERLWNQIYGKSKKDVADYSEKINLESSEHNKIPNISGNFSGSDFFTVGNKKISVKEIVDPKNPMFGFWQKVKQKSKANSLITYFNSVASTKQQMKILLNYENTLIKNNANKKNIKKSK